RSRVALGLQALAATWRPGLRARLDVSRCGGRALRAADVGGRLGPRINAAGRLGSPGLALDLILCEDPVAARDLAARLEESNRERQRIEREQSEEALRRAREQVDADPSLCALVLADPRWHPGVIGIVAARVAQTFSRPAVLLAVEGDHARGSARSFGAVRLHEALERCREHLLTWGGHAVAAGCTLAAADLDAFRAAFLAAAAEQDPGPAGPQEVDAELPLSAASASLAREIASLEPFGAGNEEPVFCAYGARTAGRVRLGGEEGRHLSFFAADARNACRAVAYGQADKEPLLQRRFDLAFCLRRGPRHEPVELYVRDIAPAGE
ncbi:MAG: DHHA1 domain-containing protein, partial [Planctomycetota bacterium]